MVGSYLGPSQSSRLEVVYLETCSGHYAYSRLALVERLPWPESSQSRLEVVHLRDVLGMLRLQNTAAEAGATDEGSG